MAQSICIVGTGHGGSAEAAFLASKDFKVNLLKIGDVEHCEHFARLQERESVDLIGIEGEGNYRLQRVSRDPAACLADCDTVLVYYVANHHDVVARAIAPHLRNDHLVYLCPGYLGSVLVLREMARIGNRAQPLMVEGETLPFSSRITGPGAVNIMSRNLVHPVASLPSSRCDEAVGRLGQIRDGAVKRDSLIEVALHNPNVIIHTIGVLMNITRVEDPAQDYFMYRHGFSETVWKFVDVLDREKMTVLEKLGCQPRSYFDEFLLRTFGKVSGQDPRAGFQHYADQAPSGPFTVLNRYITEDVPMGLGLLSSVGKHLEVPTPLTDVLISMASIALERDISAEARTVEGLGFAKLDELIAFLG